MKENKKLTNTWILLESWKTVEHDSDLNTNYDFCPWNSPQRLVKGTGEIGDQRKNRDQLEYSTCKINYDTKKTWLL